MKASIAHYLDLAYKRNVLQQRVDPTQAISADPEFRADLEAELVKIRALRKAVGNLAQRDFVSYQNERAIEAALARLKENEDAAR